MQKTAVRLLAVFLGLAGAAQAHAGYEQAQGPRLRCELSLNHTITPATIASLREAINHDSVLLEGSQQVIALQTMERLASDASVADLFSTNAHRVSELLMQINNYEEPVYQNALSNIIQKVGAAEGRLANKNAREHMRRLMTERLVPFFTVNEAQARVNAYLNGLGTLSMALGEIGEAQIFHHVYGTSPQNPSPDSLIGRYMAEVQQTLGRQVTTEWRSFFLSPTNDAQGVPRLYAAMTADMVPIVKKYFFNEHFFFQTHQPNQGTLMVSFNGETFTYAGRGRQGETRAQADNSFWPMIVLTSKEGNRMQAYFDLGKKTVANMSLADISKLPWMMGSAPDGSVRTGQYVATGAYSCCTHWFGDIPMGERNVNRYVFPSAVDQYASHNPTDKSRRESPLGDNSKVFNTQGTYIAETPAALQVVWKQGQGNMQLWEVLGLEREQTGAELTNPGFISYAMLSSVSTLRVPIVFVTNANNQLPDNATLKGTISFY